MSAPSNAIAPSRRPEQARDRAQRRRLAGAVGADQRDELARGDRQRHALQRADVAVPDVDVARAQASPSLPEVRGDDLGVGADRRRVALGDEAPVVEDLDPVAQVHHQRDVVGDEDDRDPELVAQPADQAQQLLRLDRVHAGVGLVEQQDLGLGADRAGDLEPALVAVREVAGRCGRAGRRGRTARAARIARRPAPPRRAGTTGVDRSAAEGRAASTGAGRAILTLSRTDRSPNSRMFWKVRPIPIRDDPVGRRPGDVAALERGSCRSSAAGTRTAGGTASSCRRRWGRSRRGSTPARAARS